MGEILPASWVLTGRFMYRRGWFGRLVFLVEERNWDAWRGEEKRLRKARFSDLAILREMEQRK